MLQNKEEGSIYSRNIEKQKYLWIKRNNTEDTQNHWKQKTFNSLLLLTGDCEKQWMRWSSQCRLLLKETPRDITRLLENWDNIFQTSGWGETSTTSSTVTAGSRKAKDLSSRRQTGIQTDRHTDRPKVKTRNKRRCKQAFGSSAIVAVDKMFSLSCHRMWQNVNSLNNRPTIIDQYNAIETFSNPQNLLTGFHLALTQTEVSQ